MRAMQQLDCVACTKHHSALSSGFPLSQGNAEALDRRGGKAKHCLISYFMGNTCAKNYCNRTVYVKIIASQMWDVFETQCICISVICTHIDIYL